MHIVKDDGARLGLSEYRVVLTTSSLAYLSDKVKRDDNGAEEAREIGLDFQHAIELSVDFLEDLSVPAPSQAKWNEPVLLRRPSRSSRQPKKGE
jgi:hypothetical protein